MNIELRPAIEAQAGETLAISSRAMQTIVKFPFGLRVVVSPDVEDGSPMLLDTSIMGHLYLGGLQAASDPYSGFSRNTTQLRSEFLTLCVIRNADGIFIADGSDGS